MIANKIDSRALRQKQTKKTTQHFPTQALAHIAFFREQPPPHTSDR